MAAMVAIFDFQLAGFLLFFIYMSTFCYIVRFNLIHLVVSEMSKTDFQDGSCDGHLGFPIDIDTILAKFDPEAFMSLYSVSFGSN